MREGAIAGSVFNVAYLFITLKILWLQISSPKLWAEKLDILFILMFSGKEEHFQQDSRPFSD